MVLKHPILWFVLGPALFVYLCSFLFDLRPTALEEKLSQQFALERNIKTLTKKIRDVEKEGYSGVLDQINDSTAQREALCKRLAHFKPCRYSDAYFPFLMLAGIALLFLILAASRQNAIPFLIRAFGISSGCLLCILILAQWIVAVASISLWYTRCAGLLMVFGLTSVTILCCYKFIKQFYLLWLRK